jgi:hypothetical protein
VKFLLTPTLVVLLPQVQLVVIAATLRLLEILALLVAVAVTHTTCQTLTLNLLTLLLQHTINFTTTHEN